MPVLDAGSDTGTSKSKPVRRVEPLDEGDARRGGAPAEISYERNPPAAVPRRWLLAIVLLLLLNVVATTSITWGPVVMQSARQALADRRAAAAKAQADAARAAAAVATRQREAAQRARAAAFAIPAGQVVYTEDPAEAERLLKSATGYSVTEGSSSSSEPNVRLPHPPVQWDGTAELPAIVSALGFPARGATVLLHERRTPSGTPVLLWVTVEAARDMSFGNESTGYFGHVGADRRLVTRLVNPPDAARSQWRHELTFDQPYARKLRVRLNPDRSAADANEAVVEDAGEAMRFLSGRPDPKDTTHFEIDYTLDGRPGTIDGWVRDDGRVHVEPREGAKTVTHFDASVGAETWDPRAPKQDSKATGSARQPEQADDAEPAQPREQWRLTRIRRSTCATIVAWAPRPCVWP